METRKLATGLYMLIITILFILARPAISQVVGEMITNPVGLRAIDYQPVADSAAPRVIYNRALSSSTTAPRIFYNRSATGFAAPQILNGEEPPSSDEMRIIPDQTYPHSNARQIENNFQDPVVNHTITNIFAPPDKQRAPTQTFRERTVYYPGFLPYYSYGSGSFVYSLPPPAAPTPEVVVAPPSPPSQTKEVPEMLPISSIDAFAPNKAVISRVMLSGFSVHVGSFLDYAEADNLEEQLREQEIPFFYTPVLLNDISYVQLHAGPFQERERAEYFEKYIRAFMNIPGTLLFYGM